jgi:pimeloyl-ACP methyl ester carboxylesterase
LARFGVVRFTLSRLGKGSNRLPRMIGRATSSGQGLALMERLIGEVRKMPRELWPAVQSHWCHQKSFASMGRHLSSLSQSVASIIDAPPLSVPVTLIVGVGSKTQWPDEDRARISDDLTYIVARNSGHWVQLDEPELVVDAIRKLVTGAREGERSLR